MYNKIIKCRVCGNSDLEKVMSLGDQTLTGVFPKSEGESISSGEVCLVRCSSPSGCGLVQLEQSYDLEEMYGMNYGYRSGLNSSMVRHLQKKVEEVLDFGVLSEDDIVIDIGSNDATTLRSYPSKHFSLIGVDPTGIKFSQYYPKDITLISNFFSYQAVSKELNGRKAKVITSFSMFYDLEDPIAFAREIYKTLHNEGIWVLEQSYLPLMLKTNSFDTICHEHLEFYALKQIMWIAKEANLKVLDVKFNDINGGSFSLIVSKESSKLTPNKELIERILMDEKELGLDTGQAFNSFKIRVDESKKMFMDFLKQTKNKGDTVYGLGASTKGNVLLQYYGVDRSLVTAIGEINKDKVGGFTPATLIPIISEERLLECNPDYIVVLPWHFKDFFLSLPKLKGQKLVFPLPNFEIVEL